MFENNWFVYCFQKEELTEAEAGRRGKADIVRDADESSLESDSDSDSDGDSSSDSDKETESKTQDKGVM